MATRTQPPPTPQPTRARNGWITFAGTYLVIAGALNLIWGVTALADSSYFREEGLIWSELQFWGWVAVVIAAVQILGGALIMMHKVGGMIMGLVLGGCGVLFNFLSVGAYPVWSGIAIACSFLVLWAVTVHWEGDL